jgi:hypothetical protein
VTAAAKPLPHKYPMPTFITPFSGTAELTASNGLNITSQGLWRFSESGYNDGATFGLSMTYPSPESGGVLQLRAQAWPLPGGNALTSYTDPDTGITYPAAACQIQISGRWVIPRGINSNSFNGTGVEYQGTTVTDQGSRSMGPWLLNYESPVATYVIQGSDVTGGALDTFSSHVWHCEITENSTSDNSNRQYQSNTVVRPAWIYSYTRSWQVPDANPSLLAAIQRFRQIKVR